LSIAAAHKTDTRAASATDADLIVLAIQISALCTFGRNSRDQKNSKHSRQCLPPSQQGPSFPVFPARSYYAVDYVYLRIDLDIQQSVMGAAMDDVTIWMRAVQNLIDRVSGPMHFRFILQPVMASIFAVIAGLRDAKANRPPYLWSLISNPNHRVDMVKSGWKSVGKVIIVALALDLVYQVVILHFVYLGEAIIVAFIVVVAPYLILRGLVTRLAVRLKK
jgi:hypothetical protein